MNSGGEPSPSTFPDWDQPITQEDFEAIEAAFESASSFLSSSIKRRRTSSNDSRVRRLPTTIVDSKQISTPNCDHQPGISDAKSESIQISNAIAECSSPRNQKWNFIRSPHQVDLKLRYPSMNFGGRIVYCRTISEVEKATMKLLEIIGAKKKSVDKVTLGFDIEWRPTFKRGHAPRKAAVMQICGDADCCYVMQIIHSGIPPVLQSLLEDSSSVKVGVCIANDALKIYRDYCVRVKALEDLSCLANLKLSGIPKKWSLASLTEVLTCKQMEKPNKIRLGNWEADVLSKEQLQYAATDAFASWYIYQVLKSFPDAAEKQNEEANA